jgi:hypothetical protein
VLDSASAKTGDTLTIDEVSALGSGARPADVTGEPDDMAAIGTHRDAGGPKGVMLSHRNLLSGARFASAWGSVLMIQPCWSRCIIRPFIVAAILPVLIGGCIVPKTTSTHPNVRTSPEFPSAFPASSKCFRGFQAG